MRKAGVPRMPSRAAPTATLLGLPPSDLLNVRTAASETPISNCTGDSGCTVTPGDHVTVDISNVSGNTWSISLTEPEAISTELTAKFWRVANLIGHRDAANFAQQNLAAVGPAGSVSHFPIEFRAIFCSFRSIEVSTLSPPPKTRPEPYRLTSCCLT